jgi:hypothetical protein
MGYGTNASWGLAAHWGAPDMAFGEGVSTPGLASTPAAGVWHHIAVAYDGGVERAYVDGVLNAQEAKILNIWPNDPVTLGQPYTIDGSAVFAYTTTIPYSGYLAALRVHSGVLTPGQILDNYNLGAVPPTPATLLSSPLDATVSEYGSASFNVAIGGTLPISYQWYRNGSLVPDATNALYTLAAALSADNGAEFLCVGSNVVGGTAYTVTSGVARLTVYNAAASLTHRYSFTADASDSVGTAHGTLQGGAVVANGAAALNGTAGTYVDLPGGLITGYTNLTIEFWASFGVNGNWNRVFDFGDQNASALGRYYVMFTSHSGVPDIRMSYSDADPGYNHEVVAAAAGTLDGQTNVQVVCVFEPGANSMRLYVNGVQVSSAALPFPLSSIQNVHSFVGRSLYGGDSPMNGSIDEFRIYNAALSAPKILQSFQQGPDVALGNTNFLAAVQPQSRTNILGTAATFQFRAASVYQMNYQWYFKGAPLVGQTGNTLTLASAQLADQGEYQAVAVCPLGSLTSVVATLTVNRAPLAGANGALATAQDRPVSINIEKWLFNASDPDGDAFGIAVVNPSTNGAAVVLGGGLLTYTPTPGFVGADQFSYLLRDSRGGETLVWVPVTVLAAGAAAANQLAVEAVGADVRVQFAGIPGRTYEIQRAAVPAGPWTTVQTVVCPANGIMEYLDVGAAPAGFYRTIIPAP